MEKERTIHVRQHCIVEEDNFLLKNWANTEKVNEEGTDGSAAIRSKTEEVFIDKEQAERTSVN